MVYIIAFTNFTYSQFFLRLIFVTLLYILLNFDFQIQICYF